MSTDLHKMTIARKLLTKKIKYSWELQQLTKSYYIL